jgi:hypothetical protein
MDIDRRFNMNLLSLMNVRYVLSYYPLSSKYLAEIHAPAHPLEKATWDYATGRMAHLRSSGSAWPDVVQGLRSAVQGRPGAKDHVYAYRNVCALPRAFSVAGLERHGSDGDVLQSLTKASAIELMRIARASDSDAPPVAEKLAPADLQLLRYQPGEIALDAAASGEAIVVFAQTWLSGWKAYVDGREVPLFRVNHTQIGLHLPTAGTFHVRLAYEPAYRWLNDILAVPAKLIAGAAAPEPFSYQLGVSQLPAVCASTNAQE